MSAAAAPIQANTRRLHPLLAFVASLLGFGYVYVGRIGLAFAYVIALALVSLIAASTRWIVQPVTWYPFVLIVVGIVAVPIVHSVIIAWARPRVPRKRYNRWWFYLLWFVGFAVASEAVSVDNRKTTLGYDMFRLPSGSMEPTLLPGDWIVVDTWRYRTIAPAHGDLVIYAQDGVMLLKRLVGVPGDSIELRGRVLVRNGSTVDEPYLHGPLPGARVREMRPIQLGPDEYFVLGDNRDNSNDSRYTGPIRGAEIVGRVEFIALSFSDGPRWERFGTRFTVD